MSKALFQATTEYRGDYIVGDYKHVPYDVALAVLDYTKQLREILRQQPWVIFLHTDDEPSDTDAASVNLNPNNREAGFWVGKQFLDPTALTDDLRTSVLVHEILHFELDRPWNIMDEIVQNELGRQCRSMVNRLLTIDFENTIDNLAKAITPLVPQFKLPAEKSGGRSQARR